MENNCTFRFGGRSVCCCCAFWQRAPSRSGTQWSCADCCVPKCADTTSATRTRSSNCADATKCAPRSPYALSNSRPYPRFSNLWFSLGNSTRPTMDRNIVGLVFETRKPRIFRESVLCSSYMPHGALRLGHVLWKRRSLHGQSVHDSVPQSQP